jgi:hypothetical protein
LIPKPAERLPIAILAARMQGAARFFCGGRALSGAYPAKPFILGGAGAFDEGADFLRQ